MSPIGAMANYIVNDVLPSALPLGAVETDNAVVLLSTTVGLTAHAGGGQQPASPVTTSFTEFTTVTTAADSATLPPALVPGTQVMIANAAAVNSMNVFPNTGDKINALSANAAYALAAGKNVTFTVAKAGQWYAISGS